MHATSYTGLLLTGVCCHGFIKHPIFVVVVIVSVDVGVYLSLGVGCVRKTRTPSDRTSSVRPLILQQMTAASLFNPQLNRFYLEQS